MAKRQSDEMMPQPDDERETIDRENPMPAGDRDILGRAEEEDEEDLDDEDLDMEEEDEDPT
jgi:hypothetical protein